MARTRVVKKSLKAMPILLLGVTLSLSACGSSPSSSSRDASSVSCADVSSKLVQANNDLSTDNDKTAQDAGSASQITDKSNAAKQQQWVDALTSRKAGCTTPDPTATPTPSSTPSAKPASLTASSIDTQVGTIFKGYKPGELAIGSSNVDWSNHQEDRGSASFSRKTLRTPADIKAFLAGSSDQSKAAKARVVKAIKDAGYGNDEVKRALDGSGYFAVQTKVASEILGTTYFQGGKVLDEDGVWRSVGPNDVFWLFMAKDNKIVKGASLRADCANVNLTTVQPTTPSSPPAAPVSCATTTSNGCTPTPPTPVCTSGCTPTIPPCTNAGGNICKAPQTDNCMLNGIGCTHPNPVVQPVQENPSGVNTGKTPGAPASAPPVAVAGPAVGPGKPAPTANPDGYQVPVGTSPKCAGTSCTTGTAPTGPAPTVDPTQPPQNGGTNPFQ
jgi:hypothetical protein